MPARTVKPATDTAFQNCNCLDSITVLHKYSRKSSITPAHLEKGARGKEVQKMSYRSCDFLTPAERTVEHESCPKLDGGFGDNWSMRWSRRLVRRTATCQIESPYVRSDNSQAPVPSASGCNKDGSAIEASAVKFYAYIFVANVLAFL